MTAYFFHKNVNTYEKDLHHAWKCVILSVLFKSLQKAEFYPNVFYRLFTWRMCYASNFITNNRTDTYTCTWHQYCMPFLDWPMRSQHRNKWKTLWCLSLHCNSMVSFFLLIFFSSFFLINASDNYSYLWERSQLLIRGEPKENIYI